MRVIAGKYQRRQLHTIESLDTRPTTDRVKENMFNLLQNNIYDTIVIDLFAGSGGLGIEAISRGAKKVYFVESNFKMFQILKQNLHGVVEDYETINRDALVSLKMICDSNQHVDVLILDPPYMSDYVDACLKIVQYSDAFDNNSLIVVETHRDYDNHFLGFEIVKEKKYGQIKIFILRKEV